MQPSEMTHGSDAKCHGGDALRIEVAQGRTNLIRTAKGYNIQDIINVHLRTGGRARVDVFDRQVGGIATFIQRNLLNRLAEITRFKGLRQRHDRVHDIAVWYL